MVRFVQGRSPDRRLLTVRRVPSRSGCRLLVTYPDRPRRLYSFPDESALAAGTSALQAELTAEGWEPLRRPAPRWRPAAPGLDAAGGQESAP